MTYTIVRWILRWKSKDICYVLGNSKINGWFCFLIGLASSTWTNQPTRRLMRSWRGSGGSCGWKRRVTAARLTQRSPAVWSSVWIEQLDWSSPSRVPVLRLFVTVRIREILCSTECLHPAGRHVRTVKPSSPPHYSLCVAGKEYVGIVRLHNAIESEHTLARVRLTTSC